MNTSTEAMKQLENASQQSLEAQTVIDNLVAVHDYQDVASLVTQAAVALLEAATAFMNSKDRDALAKVENAEDLLDAMYGIIEGDVED